MILIIDNYDSFVYNIARYIQQLGFATCVYRNDQITIDDIEMMQPLAIVISPGPCTPNDAGIAISIVQKLGHIIPILGICLGHQVIGQAFGAKIEKAICPTHGKARPINHNQKTIFSGLHNSLQVARYHSLIVSQDNFPSELMITSRSNEGEIMSIQHRSHHIFGLQFHPESVLTESGYDLLQNFINLITLQDEQQIYSNVVNAI